MWKYARAVSADLGSLAPEPFGNVHFVPEPSEMKSPSAGESVLSLNSHTFNTTTITYTYILYTQIRCALAPDITGNCVETVYTLICVSAIVVLTRYSLYCVTPSCSIRRIYELAARRRDHQIARCVHHVRALL